MGLLDDAIREHLELKRRRGSDPNELERQEREALGPVRRGTHEAYEASATEDPVPDAAFPDEGSAGAWPESEDEPSFIDHGVQLEQGAELFEDNEIEEWEPPARGPIQGGISVEPDTAAPATPAPPVPADPPPQRGALDEREYLEQETVEHDVEAEPEPEGEDDMLEETPEFLQDTPDHDRLWFEQRPPKDFDFDG